MLRLLLFMVVLTVCSDSGVYVAPDPPDLPAGQLLTSPDTITASERQLTLSTYMWRDFQPISPPGGKSLIAIVYVTATDTMQLPSSISADAVWIVYNQQVWKAWFTGEPIAPGQLRPNRIVRIARDGPKWGPHVFVDVIVRVYGSDGNPQLLHAPNQWISRTD